MRRICYLLLLLLAAPAWAQPAQLQRAQQIDAEALQRAEATRAAQATQGPAPCSAGAIRIAFARGTAPALIGCSYDLIRESLAPYAQRIRVSERAAEAEAGTVADQLPSPGASLPQDSVLILRISTGPAPAPTASATPEPLPSAVPEIVPTPAATDIAPAPVETAVAQPGPADNSIPWWLVPALVGAAAVMLLGALLTALLRRAPTSEPEPEPDVVTAVPPLRFACEVEPGGVSLVAEQTPLVEAPRLGLRVTVEGETTAGAVPIEEERTG